MKSDYNHGLASGNLANGQFDREFANIHRIALSDSSRPILSEIPEETVSVSIEANAQPLSAAFRFDLLKIRRFQGQDSECKYLGRPVEFFQSPIDAFISNFPRFGRHQALNF